MTNTHSASVSLRNVSRTFGEHVALHPMNLEIPAGEFVSLLGPSGCGKTTTLRIVAGLESPDDGEIWIGDRNVTHISPNQRHLGMVFQNYALFPHLTVSENVAFGLQMAKTPKAEIAPRVSRMLDMVHLSQFADRMPTQLSGGQQQRVALARSLATNPNVLLLDEPMAALDKNLRESMQYELRQIQESFGTTTIMVTHDQEEALSLSDRIVVMNQGRVLQSGAPQEIYDAPSDRFVSEFLGASNLIDCRVADIGPEGATLTPGGDIRLTAPARPGLSDGATVTLAVRPEKISLSSDRPGAGPALPGTVMTHIFRGASHAYRIQPEGSDNAILVYEQASGGLGTPAREVGSKVWVHWSPDAQTLL